MGVPYAEVIGDPIAHSKSPLIHNYWLREAGIEAEYRATRVTAGDLPSYFAARRADPDWRGCNVTMPLKSAVIPYIDDLYAEGKRLQAVNFVTPRKTGLFATNFDAEAIINILAPEYRGEHAVIIGSGGAARAALWAAILLAPRVTVMSRSAEKAQRMITDLGAKAEVRLLEGDPECDLLFNATPLGMRGHPPLNIGLSKMHPDGIVFEMVYDPPETSLLAAARRRRLACVDGATMLVEQADLSAAHLFGVRWHRNLAAAEELVRQ